MKINIHPWPEERWCRWRPVHWVARQFTEDRASTSSPPRTSAPSCSTSTSASDDEGRILGLGRRFWHDHGAYTPYGLIVPIITSTQLLGPPSPVPTGWLRVALHQHRDGHALPRRRPAAGCFAMERTMDAIATGARQGP